MFGRKPKLPIDAMFEKAADYKQLKKTTEEYIVDLRERLRTTREIAETDIDRAKKKTKVLL